MCFPVFIIHVFWPWLLVATTNLLFVLNMLSGKDIYVHSYSSMNCCCWSIILLELLYRTLTLSLAQAVCTLPHSEGSLPKLRDSISSISTRSLCTKSEPCGNSAHAAVLGCSGLHPFICPSLCSAVASSRTLALSICQWCTDTHNWWMKS